MVKFVGCGNYLIYNNPLPKPGVEKISNRSRVRNVLGPVKFTVMGGKVIVALSALFIP